MQGKDCYICKGGGHRAKDCPKKYKRSQASELCLKCGASAHAMSSCRNDYSHDDLKVFYFSLTFQQFSRWWKHFAERIELYAVAFIAFPIQSTQILKSMALP